MPNGGLRLPRAEDGLYSFEPPHTCRALKAATLGDATNGRPSRPEKLTMELHVNRGRTSAQELKRVLVDPDRGSMH